MRHLLKKWTDSLLDWLGVESAAHDTWESWVALGLVIAATVLESPANLPAVPEAAAVEFVARCHRTLPHRTEHVHQFAFARRTEHVTPHLLGPEPLDAQLLAHLTAQRLFDRLAESRVPARRRVPASGLDVFPCRAFLQVELALRVENMQVHHRMQQHRPAVAPGPRRTPHRPPFGIDDGEKFLLVLQLR